MITEPTPTEIILHKKSRTLEVKFDSGECFLFSCEYLRVHSPSAEVQGHGIGNQKLVLDKTQVNILAIDPVGNYAIKPTFSDGHQSGIFSWKTLYNLGIHQTSNWNLYLEKVKYAKGNT